jgi:hypothetical protein
VAGVHIRYSKLASTTAWNHIGTRPSTPPGEFQDGLSANPVTTSSGTNPWTNDTIQNALSTLNNSKASADDQVTAYKAITDLISSHPSQGGAARVAVVTDAGFTNFAARTTQISNQMEQGVTRSNTATQQLSNFNALSSDDQEIYAKLNPGLGTIDNVKANFTARIQLEQIVQGVLAAGNYNSLDQVTSSKYAALKSLGSAQSTNAWTTQAQQVITQIQSTSQTTDKINLSAAAQALVTPSHAPPFLAGTVKPSPTLNNADVGLQALTSARNRSTANNQNAVQASALNNRAPYEEGSIFDTKI